MNKLERALAVPPGSRIKLSDIDPANTHGVQKAEASKRLAKNLERLSVLQYLLYAEARRSLLVVLQGIDAGGKDGTIRHVMSGLNPQGVSVTAFKVPEGAEKRHDYLWRVHQAVPEWGQIGIFNRSHYEEVLVVRVHKEILEAQKLPPELVTKKIWEERYDDINAFERHLARNGTVIRKFFLNVSREEQKKRLLARLDDPDKNWKFSSADAEERRLWKEYGRAYEEMIAATSTKWAPWYAVPADNKWFTRVVVASVIIQALEDLDLSYPKIGKEKRRELARVRKVIARS